MTKLQQKTIDEMMRQGLHTQLEIAEHNWQENRTYEPEAHIHISRLLSDLIKKSNHQAEHIIH